MATRSHGSFWVTAPRVPPASAPQVRAGGRQPAYGRAAASASTSIAFFAVTFALGSGLAGLGGALAIEIVGLDHAFAFTYLVYVPDRGGRSAGLGFNRRNLFVAARPCWAISDMGGKVIIFPELGAFRYLFHHGSRC